MKLRIAAAGCACATLLLATAPLNAKVIHFTAKLNGASEVPPNDSSGSGMLKASLNDATNQFTYEVHYSGLSGPPVAAHFHGPAAAGANAPPVIPIKALGNPIKGNATIYPAQAKDLIAGKWYFNVHTAAHGPGEIRGQLIAP